MKRPHLLKDTAVYALTNVATKLIGALLLPIITRLITPAEYGAIDVIVLFTLIALELSMCGMDFILALYFHDEGIDHRKLIGTLLSVRLGLGIALTGVIHLGLPIIAISLLGNPRFPVLQGYYIAIWTMPFTGVISLGFMLLRQTSRSIILLWAILVRVLLTAFLTGFFVWRWSDAIAGYFAAGLIADGLLTLVMLGIFKPSVRNFDAHLALILIKKGIGFLPRSIYFVLMTLITRQLLLHFGSLQDVGLYAAAVKISFIVWVGVSASSQAWLSYSMAIAHETNAHEHYRHYLTNYVAWMGLLVSGVALFAPELLRLFTTEIYVQAAPAVGWLALSLGAVGSLVIVSTGLNITKQTASIGKTTIIAAMVNIILAVVLIPRFGMLGSAIAAACDQLCAAMILYYLAQKHYPLPFNLPMVLSSLALTIMLVFLSTWLPRSWNGTVFVAKVLGIMAYAVVVLRYSGIHTWFNKRMVHPA